MSEELTSVTPVAPPDRIVSVDVLRGLAVLGILVINIQPFSMVLASLSNPTAFGDLGGVNYGVALLSYLFAQLKFMTLFSLLFGAGIVLMAQKIEAGGRRPAKWHYRRMLWLIVIGLLHAYLLWYGDILFSYGLCGLIVYLFRKKSAKTLLIVGLIVIFIGSLIMFVVEASIPYWPQELLAQSMQGWQPDAQHVAQEVTAYRGGWLAQMAHRLPTAIMFQTFAFFMLVLWRAGGLMLIGMALFKWGVLSGEASKKSYRRFVVAGLSVGLPLVGLGWLYNELHHWAFDRAMFEGTQFNYWGSLLVSLAYIGAVMLILQAGRLKVFSRALAAVGRLALTNYLLQTVICTSLFYGHGFGLFGRVDRLGQILIVVLILAFQMVASPLWLKHFRFGPAEWLWRSLTYWKRQPLKKPESG